MNGGEDHISNEMKPSSQKTGVPCFLLCVRFRVLEEESKMIGVEGDREEENKRG